MEKLDDVTISALKAANIDEGLLSTLSRDDLRDLLPGPEHFLRRKQLWAVINPEEGLPTSPMSEAMQSSRVMASVKHQTTTLTHESPLKTLQLPSPPEYVVYTDTELEQCRNTYFTMARNGREEECDMSKELRCRLVRNTITSMVSLLRASPGQVLRYPSKTEIAAMAKRIVEYYPMLQDKDKNTQHETINGKLQKRLQNIKSPTKKQGPTPKRGQAKRKLIEGFQSDEVADTDEDADSSASTIILSPSSNSDDASTSSEKTSDSLLLQVRHYKALQEMCKKPRPNQEDVSQLLDLEFNARRAFIDSDTLKEEDRAHKILDAYACFKEIHHVLCELKRILDPQNEKFVDEVKIRWEEFCTQVQYYGVSKKVLKPPMTMTKTEAQVALINVLPTLFPSPALPLKKIRTASEALLHVLKATEDPQVYLQKRSLLSPVLVYDGYKCIIAVGNIPVSTFDKEQFGEGVIYLMAYYYAFHLTYPKCVATLLSIIQTEVLLDAIHDRDATASYRKVLGEWRAFIGK